MLLTLAGALCWHAVLAQQAAPEGLPAGPWVLAPSLVIGYEYNTNVFQQDEDLGPISDYSLVVEPAITATLPFRNSYLEFTYKATWQDYGKAFPDAKLSQEAGLRLSLLFASMDRLTIGGSRIFGVAQTETFDPGGEVVYDGKEFQLDEYSVELQREQYGHRGYKLRVGRRDLHFDPSDDLQFFDFEGWSAEGEYREPLNPNLWIVGAYLGTRYDHFCQNIDPLGNPCPDSSTPIRRESSDTAYLGLRGALARNQPYLLRVGASSYRYDISGARDFSGVTAEGNMAFPIGGGTSLRLGLSRRPYPSFFLNSNFYVVSRIETQLEHRSRNESTTGFRLAFWTSHYSDPIDVPGFPQDGVVRHDQLLRAEAYATVLLVRRFGFTISAARQTRDSNIEDQSYVGTSYFAGVTYAPR